MFSRNRRQIVFCIKKLFAVYICFLAITAVSSEEKNSWFNPMDNLRLAIDLSVRPQFDVKNDRFSHIESAGFDLHKVFSSAQYGDLGTLVLQGYFNKLNNVENHAPFFKGSNDFKFVCRICNVNLTVLNKGLLNIRLGHYETPFGLEYNIDTNGTLKQYSNSRDLGNKLDWGVAINGKSSWLGYEISLGRGVGVDWTSDYSSFIVSGRFEITDDYDSVLGFSAFHGHIKNDKLGPAYIDKTRLGLDASTSMGPFTFLGEISLGQDNSVDRFNSLVELDIQNKTEEITAFFQFIINSQRFKHQLWDSLLQTNLGMSYTLYRYWIVSTQWAYNIDSFRSTERFNRLEFQLRYRF